MTRDQRHKVFDAVLKKIEGDIGPITNPVAWAGELTEQIEKVLTDPDVPLDGPHGKDAKWDLK